MRFSRVLACSMWVTACFAAAPTISTIVSGGSFNPSKISAGAFATVVGSDLSDQQYTDSVPWPKQLGATTVTIYDNERNNCVFPQLT
jgi:hypothetical protein